MAGSTFSAAEGSACNVEAFYINISLRRLWEIESINPKDTADSDVECVVELALKCPNNNL